MKERIKMLIFLDIDFQVIISKAGFHCIFDRKKVRKEKKLHVYDSFDPVYCFMDFLL